jgi:cytosine/adenosine deaminase-related metal-dependent hydrolase
MANPLDPSVDPFVAAPATVLCRVRPWGGSLSDVVLQDGVITSVRPAEQQRSRGERVIDGAGRLVIPSFTDAHAHLDSTRLGLPFRPHSAGPGLLALIENDRAHWRDEERTVAERAAHTLAVTIASGTTTVRSHAQVDSDAGLERLEAVLAAREAHASRAMVQVVAFPQSGIVRDRGTAGLLLAAMNTGADLVGGIDPCGLDRNPVEHLDTVFDLAQRHQSGIDIHLHEAGELGAFTLSLVFERVRALSMQGKVTISHAFALPTLAPDRAAAVIDDIAALDIALTTVAPAGGRHLQLDLLAAQGVRVGLGQDGIRDYWSPYGNGDMLDRTWQLAFINQFRHDDQIDRCVALATLGGRAVVAADGSGPGWTAPSEHPRGLALGDPADLVLLPGDTVTSAVMDRPAARTVIRQGRIVAENGVVR